MRKSVVIVTILIVALIITGGALFMWRQGLADTTDQQASQSANASPSATPSFGSADVPSANETAQPVEQNVSLFWVAVGDTTAGAEIGCGDSLVGVNQKITTSTPLADTIRALLAIKDENYGQSGLYNALWQSDLSLQSASISNGVATIALTGNLRLGGACDNPRVKEQLTVTATQFDSVDSANITLNGQPLDQALSAQ